MERRGEERRGGICGSLSGEFVGIGGLLCVWHLVIMRVLVRRLCEEVV